jgi:hypothetical protein
MEAEKQEATEARRKKQVGRSGSSQPETEPTIEDDYDCKFTKLIIIKD